MSESLEIIYFGRGTSKGKGDGVQKPMQGITIARGKPVKAWLTSMTTLEAMGYEVENALLKHLFKSEWENFKKKL